MLNDQPQSWNHLTTFQQRITEILTQDKLDVDQGRQTRRILEFSQEAKYNWIGFRNNIEFDLNAGRYLADVDDGASKITNNLARMAALFHFFEGHQGEISAETLRNAGIICEWYTHEFKRLFAKNPEVPIWVSDAIDLENSLVRWCQNHPGHYAILKGAIAQYGPAQLRKDSNRREAAIYELDLQNKIKIQKHENKLLIFLNPAHFPVPTYAYGQYQCIQQIPHRIPKFQ